MQQYRGLGPAWYETITSFVHNTLPPSLCNPNSAAARGVGATGAIYHDVVCSPQPRLESLVGTSRPPSNMAEPSYKAACDSGSQGGPLTVIGHLPGLLSPQNL